MSGSSKPQILLLTITNLAELLKLKHLWENSSLHTWFRKNYTQRRCDEKFLLGQRFWRRIGLILFWNAEFFFHWINCLPSQPN